MIQIGLPDGPASPLVRGLAACLSSVTEVPLDEFPEFQDLVDAARDRCVEELARRP